MEETRKQKMKRLRKAFNDACWERDKGQCVCCTRNAIDVHHVTNRHDMPNDGYAKENGISLCAECHIKAESFHPVKNAIHGFSPEELYTLIESSKEKAVEACEKLE